MGASLQSIVSASKDMDLRERIEAAAAEMGVQPGVAAARISDIVSTEIKAGFEVLTLASQYESAVSRMPPPPGRDPEAVTDDLIRKAVSAVCGGTQ